jgi:hypothetical protein
MGLPVNESELAGTDLFVPQSGSAEPHPAEARPPIHPAHPRPRNQPFLPESSDCIAPLAGSVGLEKQPMADQMVHKPVRLADEVQWAHSTIPR